MPYEYLPTVKNFDPDYNYSVFPSGNGAERELFKPSMCERDLRPKNVRDIKNELLSGQAIRLPIIVNIRTNNIIDGNHRWNAWLQAVEEGYALPIRVSYIDVKEEDEFTEFLRLNSGSPVSVVDFVKCATKVGRVNTNKLTEFAKKHVPLTWDKHNNKLTRGVTECLIFGGTVQPEFIKRNGDYRNITDDMLSYADKLAGEIPLIMEGLKLDKNGGRTRTITSAWYAFRKPGVYEASARVDAIGIIKFAEKLRKYVIKEFGLSKMSQNDWIDSFCQSVE